MSWFKACGDEECACCGKTIPENDDAYYNKVIQKVTCLVCTDTMEDEAIGKALAEDSRFNTDYDY